MKRRERANATGPGHELYLAWRELMREAGETSPPNTSVEVQCHAMREQLVDAAAGMPWPEMVSASRRIAIESVGYMCQQLGEREHTADDVLEAWRTTAAIAFEQGYVLGRRSLA